METSAFLLSNLQVANLFNANSKIFVVGTSGAGKSTFARKLAAKLNLPDIELDNLFWKANWQETSDEEFSEKIIQAINQSSGWVMHGNYNRQKNITWKNCDTLIWLDYSKSIVMYRVIMRSVKRMFTREKLWAGNIETFRQTFLSKKSIIVWSWQTYARRREQYLRFMKDPEFTHVRVIVFKKPRDAFQFLKNL